MQKLLIFAQNTNHFLLILYLKSSLYLSVWQKLHPLLLFFNGNSLNYHRLQRLIPAIGFYLADFLDYIHALDNLTKHSMLVIQPSGRSQGNEELATTGIRTCVSHGNNTRFIVI